MIRLVSGLARSIPVLPLAGLGVGGGTAVSYTIDTAQAHSWFAIAPAAAAALAAAGVVWLIHHAPRPPRWMHTVQIEIHYDQIVLVCRTCRTPLSTGLHSITVDALVPVGRTHVDYACPGPSAQVPPPPR